MSFRKTNVAQVPRTPRRQRRRLPMYARLSIATLSLLLLAIGLRALSSAPAANITVDVKDERSGIRVENATRALDRASAWMNNGKDSYSSALVWLLVSAHSRTHTAALSSLVAYARETAVADPLARLVGGIPNDITMHDQVDTTHPMQLLVESVAACDKDTAAQQRVSEFVSEDHRGYLLTHQLLFAHWAQRHGCDLGQRWPARKDVLHAIVVEELRANAEVSDLVVEQLAVLQLDAPSIGADSRWIEALLAHQNDDGSFGQEQRVNTLVYQGATIPQMLGPVHMTPLAIFVLASAMNGQRAAMVSKVPTSS